MCKVPTTSFLVCIYRIHTYVHANLHIITSSSLTRHEEKVYKEYLLLLNQPNDRQTHQLNVENK